MRLLIVLPTNWEVSRSDRRLVAVAPSTVQGGVRIEVEPIVWRPDDPAVWRDECIARHAPSDGRAAINDRAELTSAVGWPLNVFDIEITRAGAVIERQLHVFYFILEYACHVVAHVTSPDAYGALRDELLKVLASGRPLWDADGEIVALQQLWHDVEMPPSPEAGSSAPR